jgi:Ca2+-binding EF-hand superfamily protein
MMRAVVAMCSQSLRCSQCIPPCVAKHSSDLPTLSSRPQFPNLNKLITREIFAELTSEATCETSGIPLAILRQAALQVFDERLDTIGSGMVSVRQILSFYRHGFLEAAGQPHEVSGEHFARASTPYREMARVYDDAEPISPRRFPTSREPSRSRPRIPLAHSTKHSLSGSTGLRPKSITSMRSSSQMQDHHPRAATSGSFRQHAHAEFGAMRYELESSSSSEEEALEHFDGGSPNGREWLAPWGAPARTRQVQVEPQQRLTVQTSQSLPTLAPSTLAHVPVTPKAPDTLMRLVAARFHGCPKLVKQLFQELDDGNGKTTPDALALAVRELGGRCEPPLTLNEAEVLRLVRKFVHRSSGVVVLRDFAKAMAMGRLPFPQTRRSLPQSPPAKERSPLRGKKAASAKTTVAAVIAAKDASLDQGNQSSKPSKLWEKALGKHSSRRPVSQADLFGPVSMASLRSPNSNVERCFDQALEMKKKAARAAALMIAALREKAALQHGGELTKRKFNETMVELGILHSVDDDTDVLFASIDEDSSGIINIRELELALKQLVDPSMVSELEGLLKDGASIDSSIQSVRDKLSAQATRVIDLFQKWDTNHDGKISREEFLRAMPHLGLKHCLPVEIMGLFSAFDPDGSGEISFRELHKMLRQTHAPKKGIVVEEAKTPLVNLDELRKTCKQDVLKMNMQVEIQDIAMLRRAKDDLRKKKRGQHDLYHVLDEEDIFGQPVPVNLRPKAASMWAMAKTKI